MLIKELTIVDLTLDTLIASHIFCSEHARTSRLHWSSSPYIPETRDIDRHTYTSTQMALFLTYIILNNLDFFFLPQNVSPV